MIEVCDKNLCTGCGTCISVCPQKCITWQKDDLDTLLPNISVEECVDCGACRRVCHINHEMEFHMPTKCYASWALDPEIRRTSASGGITSVFYQYTLEQGGFTCGVEFDFRRGAYYVPVENTDDINRVKNSKYVFSRTDGIFKKIKTELKSGRFVFFVGLPCQVAALKLFLGKLFEAENLLSADILCHGVANEEYLFQYLKELERQKKKHPNSLSFRDPEYGTEKYIFTLRAENNKVFYKQNHYGGNLYYIGYMNELMYRENCYHCRYARTERVSDLTFGDFDGLGAKEPFNYWNRQVSLCLVNTERGAHYLQKVSDRLFLEERKLQEAVIPQKQLKGPAQGHPNRKMFLEEYRKTHDFPIAARHALAKELVVNRKKEFIRKYIKLPIKMLIPLSILMRIKKIH